MHIETKEGKLGASVYYQRKGIYVKTEHHEFVLVDMSFNPDKEVIGINQAITLIEKDTGTESLVLSNECLDFNIINVNGDVMFSITDRCHYTDLENIILTAQGKQILLNIMRRSLGLNKSF